MFTYNTGPMIGLSYFPWVFNSFLKRITSSTVCYLCIGVGTRQQFEPCSFGWVSCGLAESEPQFLLFNYISYDGFGTVICLVSISIRGWVWQHSLYAEESSRFPNTRPSPLLLSIQPHAFPVPIPLKENVWPAILFLSPLMAIHIQSILATVTFRTTCPSRTIWVFVSVSIQWPSVLQTSNLTVPINTRRDNLLWMFITHQTHQDLNLVYLDLCKFSNRPVPHFHKTVLNVPHIGT